MWLEGKFPEVRYFDEPEVKYGGVLWNISGKDGGKVSV
jgi:hypothetical protein